MRQRKWHPESGVNPPLNRIIEDRASKGEVFETHKNCGINAAYDLFPEARPLCTGNPGCPCQGCCKMRGRMLERER